MHPFRNSKLTAVTTVALALICPCLADPPGDQPAPGPAHLVTVTSKSSPDDNGGRWVVSGTRNTDPGAQWFPKVGMGVLLHWGIESLHPTGHPWHAIRTEANKNVAVPATEFWDLAPKFDPQDYDPDKWMAAIKDAGFGYVVITTRHHMGYSLWPSKVNDMSTRTYMHGRDLLRPFVEAARRHGLKVGFYFSGADWYFEHEYMNFSRGMGIFVNYKGQVVPSLPAPPPDFAARYKKFNMAQVRELLTNYGPIDIFWSDAGRNGIDLAELRRLQPGILVNNRGDAHDGDFATPEGWSNVTFPDVQRAWKNNWWWELCDIWNGGYWHYSKAAEKLKPAALVLAKLTTVRSLGGNLLINIAPRPDGQLPADAYVKLAEVAAWMKYSAPSILGQVEPGPLPPRANIPVTIKQNIWYCHAQPLVHQSDADRDPIILKDVDRPATVTLLRTGESLAFNYDNRILTILIPPEKRTRLPDTVAVRFGD